MTEGPWTVELRYGTLMVFGGEDGTDFVAEITEANARLIAAAPEMLAMLKAILQRPRLVWDDERPLEQLIAKIEGTP